MEPSRKPQRGALLIANLPALQNLVRRDPDAYASEFATQWDHYDALRRVMELGLGAGESGAGGAASVAGTSGGGGKGRRETEERFREVVGFLCRTAPSYGVKKKPIRPVMLLPSQISALLLHQHDQLSNDTRKSLISGLIGLRRQGNAGPGLMSDIELLKVLFPLLSLTTSTSLRATILKTILTDIKRANLKAKNHALNRTVQGFLFTMIERGLDPTSSTISGTGVKGKRPAGAAESTLSQSETQAAGREAMWAVKLAAELWRKGVWNDAKTVHITATACFHPHTKVQSAACHFFLAEEDQAGATGPDLLDSDADSGEEVNIRQVKHVQTINKKRKASERRAKAQIKMAHKKAKAKAAAAEAGNPNFSALQLLQDPQTFGERLYDALLKNDKRYTLEHKLLLVRLFSRVSAVHQLQVLGFYSWTLKYLSPSQLSITSLLASITGSVHQLTPPDALTPVVRKLAHDFVHPGVASAVVAAGLNAITQLCRRQPLAMEGEETMLEDLVEYRKSKDKGVMVAARSLLGLYREVAPEMLKRRERGKAASIAKAASRGPGSMGPASGVRFGAAANGVQGIAGLDLLEAALQDKKTDAESGSDAKGNDDNAGEWEGWEVNSESSESSEDSGGWIDVSSDEDGGGLEISSDSSSSDSEDEPGTGEKAKRETRRQKKERERKRRRLASGNWRAGEPSDNEEEIDAGRGPGSSAVAADDDADAPGSGSAPEGADEESVSDNMSEVSNDLEHSSEEKEVELPAGEDGAAKADDLAHSLAATKILTPADFARLAELRAKALEEATSAGAASRSSAARRKLAALQASASAAAALASADGGGGGGSGGDGARFVSEGDIVGVQKKVKADYEERMASVAKGREDRGKFGSKKMRGRKGEKNGAPGSSTNEAKARGKAFAMTQHSARVRSKKGASLRDRQKKLRAHVDRAKRGGRRGNG